MKKLILSTLLCVGCASSTPAPVPPPKAPECPSAAPAPTCTDQLMSLTDEDLKKGVTCPANSRLVFPSAFYNKTDKLLVMCQCRQ